MKKVFVSMLLAVSFLGSTANISPIYAEPAAVASTASAAFSADRQKTMESIKELSHFDHLNLYSMEVFYDYDVENLISPAGVYDEQDVIDRYLKEALPGMKINFSMPSFGCSAFTLKADDGHVYLGRNYDFKYDTSAMQVYCHPKDGYRSISYCALDNLKIDDPLANDAAKAAALLAPFAPLDGMNEKGVAIAVLTLPCKPTIQRTGKPVISTSTAIRLVLDKAATTQEAVDLLARYDMFSSCGRDYHFYITDSTGDGRIIEYDCDREDRPMVVTPIRTITNYFGMYEDKIVPGDNGIYGTATSWQRRENIENTIKNAKASNADTAMDALKSAASEPNPDSIVSNTQWSIVYDLTDLHHDFVLHRRWQDVFSFERLSFPSEKTAQKAN